MYPLSWFRPGRRLLGVAAAVLLVSAACGDGPSDAGNSIQVGLINGDSNLGQPIHLFGPGDDFPCCRVDPLSTLDVFLTVKSGDQVTFRAGRSGTILATVQCTVNNFAGKIVRWNPASVGSNTGTLTCHTGW